jgi:hypothetical protein
MRQTKGCRLGSPAVRSEPFFAQVSIRYRPRVFSILKGL